jgi:hypothetical protein
LHPCGLFWPKCPLLGCLDLLTFHFGLNPCLTSLPALLSFPGREALDGMRREMAERRQRSWKHGEVEVATDWERCGQRGSDAARILAGQWWCRGLDSARQWLGGGGKAMVMPASEVLGSG